MATASSTLRNNFLPNGGVVWAIVPALAAVGAWMVAPPSAFDHFNTMSLIPSFGEASVAAEEAPANEAKELDRDFSLMVDPPVSGAPAEAVNVEASPMGFQVGKPRRYNVDYKVFGSRNRANYDVYVDGIEKIEGNPYYKVTTVLTGTPRDRTDTMYYRTSDKGVHRRFQVKDKTYEMLWYPAPFEVGNKWNFEVDGVKHSGCCEAVEEIEVNGEKLQCFRVCLDGSFGCQTEWLCPGRGIVKVSQRAKIYSAEVVVDPSAVVPSRESIALND